MAKKSAGDQSAIIPEIRRLEKSFKADLTKTEKVLRQEILIVEERVESVDLRLENKMDKQHDEVMTAISNFAGRVEKLEEENVVGAEQYYKLDERLSKVEATVS